MIIRAKFHHALIKLIKRVLITSQIHITKPQKKNGWKREEHIERDG